MHAIIPRISLGNSSCLTTVVCLSDEPSLLTTKEKMAEACGIPFQAISSPPSEELSLSSVSEFRSHIKFADGGSAWVFAYPPGVTEEMVEELCQIEKLPLANVDGVSDCLSDAIDTFQNSGSVYLRGAKCEVDRVYFLAEGKLLPSTRVPLVAKSLITSLADLPFVVAMNDIHLEHLRKCRTIGRLLYGDDMPLLEPPTARLWVDNVPEFARTHPLVPGVYLPLRLADNSSTRSSVVARVLRYTDEAICELELWRPEADDHPLKAGHRLTQSAKWISHQAWDRNGQPTDEDLLRECHRDIFQIEEIFQ